MSQRSFTPHLPPHELARRQRWIAVGVSVLAFLLVATWLVTLPSRLTGDLPGHTWDTWWGKAPAATYINVEDYTKDDNTQATLQKTLQMLQARTATSTPTSTAAVTTTSSAALSTSTLNFLKKNIK